MTQFAKPAAGSQTRCADSSGRPQSFGMLVLAGAILGAISCGPSEVITRVPEDQVRLKAIATVYVYACRELGRPPTNFDELRPIFERAKVDTPQDYLQSTRDGMPYVIIWGLDLERQFLGSDLPLAYERAGQRGRRLIVTCNQTLLEINPDEFLELEWPTGHVPEL